MSRFDPYHLYSKIGKTMGTLLQFSFYQMKSVFSIEILCNYAKDYVF